MDVVHMRRVVDGKVQERAMPRHLAESYAAKMGGWVKVEKVVVPIPEVKPKRQRIKPTNDASNP